MLILELHSVVKGFGDRILFRIDNLKVYSQERIGIVGLNGSGKTTLLKIMAGIISPDQGVVKQYGKGAYIAQLDDESPEAAAVERVLARQFQIAAVEPGSMSGGERTRQKIATALSKSSQILFADEPTANLDQQGIQLLEEKLASFPGTIMLVDRRFVNTVATDLMLIQDQRIQLFKGNYEQYQKSQDQQGLPQTDPSVRMVLEHRLSEIVSRLAAPGKKDDIVKLDRKYREILSQLRQI